MSSKKSSSRAMRPLSTYNCVAKSGKNFRNTEFFSFEGDKVKRIDVYFGATYQNGAFVRQNET